MDELESAQLPRPTLQGNRNFATFALLLGLLSPVMLAVVAVIESSLSGTQLLVGRVADPAPLYERALALLPLWACIGATFYFGLQERREATSAILMVVSGLVLALGAALGGLFVTVWALFPTG